MTAWRKIALAGTALAMMAACTPKEKPAEPSAPAEKAFAAVDTKRIETASGGAEWLTYGGTYDEQRHSTLTAINKDNVSSLGVAWTYDL
ncbi:MAG: PQQ-dependent dehydrogenase, methanol/ethanol family, partial [Hyphomonas sp.]|nr:PQQ-dependent dehydrogenase, methanol/ethanol family [Hyphomonas sp.]